MKNLWRSSFLLLLFLYSCTTPNEGCLDINAINYNVTAGVECEQCCIYPNLAIQFETKFANEPVALNQFIYQNQFGETYGIISGRFILSNFLLNDRNGVDYKIRDSILLETTDSDSLFFTRDFVYFSDLSTRSYNLGLFPVENEFVNLGFNLGLSGEACFIEPLEVPDSENLSRGLRGLYDLDLKKYYAARFEILVDTSNAQMNSKIIYLPLCDIDMRNEFSVNLGGIAGFNLPIPLRLDLNEVLKGIQLSPLDSINEISQWRSDFISGFYIE